MNAIAPLATAPNLIEQVLGRLVDAIAEGTLAPGARLTQDDLATSLGVSRQPVSHALQLLKRQGLAIETGKRGLSVAPIEPDFVRDLYRFRGVLEGLSALRAAERVANGSAPRDKVDDLREALDAGLALPKKAPVHDWIAADIGFHQSLHQLGGNDVVIEAIDERWPHFKRLMGVRLSDADGPKRVWAEHVDIVEHVLAGRAARAQRAAVDHMTNAMEIHFQSLAEA